MSVLTIIATQAVFNFFLWDVTKATSLWLFLLSLLAALALGFVIIAEIGCRILHVLRRRKMKDANG